MNAHCISRFGDQPVTIGDPSEGFGPQAWIFCVKSCGCRCSRDATPVVLLGFHKFGPITLNSLGLGFWRLLTGKTALSTQNGPCLLPLRICYEISISFWLALLVLAELTGKRERPDGVRVLIGEREGETRSATAVRKTVASSACGIGSC